MHISWAITPCPWLNRCMRSPVTTVPGPLKSRLPVMASPGYRPEPKLNIIFVPATVLPLASWPTGMHTKVRTPFLQQVNSFYRVTTPNLLVQTALPSQRLTVIQACSWFFLPAMLLPTPLLYASLNVRSLWASRSHWLWLADTFYYSLSLGMGCKNKASLGDSNLSWSADSRPNRET